MKESALIRRILKLCRDRGAWAEKIHGSQFSRGVPDVLVCYKGWFIGLEAKTPGNEKKVTELQANQLRKIKEAEGMARVVSTPQEVGRILDEVDEAEKL